MRDAIQKMLKKGEKQKRCGVRTRIKRLEKSRDNMGNAAKVACLLRYIETTKD